MLQKIIFFKFINYKYIRFIIYTPIILLFIILFIFFKNPVFTSKQEVLTKGVASSTNLKSLVTRLVNTEEFRNHHNLVQLNSSADFIFKELTNMGLTPIWQKYKYEGVEYKNIIIKFGEQINKPAIVLGAHYDVCFDTPGADDNASGVAGLIELARLLKLNKESLERPIELVFYTLEEPPFFRSQQMGSYIHAKSKKDNNEKITLMISVEMIGFYNDDFMSQNYPFSLMYLYYPTQANFIALVGRLQDWSLTRKVKSILKINSQIDLRSINAPSKLSGIDFSDHLNYWAFDYPALMVTDTSFYRNNNYHKTTDLPETLDYNKMGYVVQQLLILALNYKEP